MNNLPPRNNSKKFFNVNYLFFIICVSLLFYQSFYLLTEFMSGKTVINISVEKISNTSLPTVTLCPYYFDFSRLSLLNENVSILYKHYLKMIENANRSRISDIQDYLYDIYFKAVNIYFNSKGNKIKIKELLYNIPGLFNKMNETIFSSIIYESSAYGQIDKDLIKYEYAYYTNYIMKSLPMESIRMYLREKYPFILQCYTLFSHSESSWNNINMVFHKFLITLKLDYYAQPITPSMAMGIIMHSPNTMTFEGYSYFNPGYQYRIKYSKWNIESLGKGYDTDCREYDPKIYTRNDCIFDCYQERAKYHCQTKDFVSCPLLKKKIYFEQSYLNFSKCNIKMKMVHEILEICYNQCNRECHITYYSFTIDKIFEIDMYQADLFFKHNEMPDLTIRHIPEMPLLTLICNFGGILGMWLGVSFSGILKCVWNLLRAKILSKISAINFNINNINNFNNINNNNNILFISMNSRRERDQTWIRA